MKSTTILAFAVLAAILFSVPTFVQAQTTMRVKVPFDFYIGDQRFPTGQYAMWRGQGFLVRLSDANGHTSASFAIFGYRPSSGESGRLIFNRYGESHFLTEIRWPASDATSQFPTSSREREAAQNVAPERVATTSTNR